MSSKDYVIIKDGELVHFKYIKREKVNGEWRYYYDKGSVGRSIKKAVGIDARNAYRSARDAAVTAENEHKEAYANKQKETAEAKTTRAEADAAKKDIPAVSPVSDNDLKKLQDEYVRATDAVALAKKRLAEEQKVAAQNYERVNSASSGLSSATRTSGTVKDGSASIHEGDAPGAKSANVIAAQKRLAEAEQNAERAKAEYNNAFKASQEAKKAQSERDKAVKKADAYSQVADKQAKEAAEATAKNNEAAKKSAEAQQKAQEALKKYYKTPLGSLKFLSDKGKELLYKIF